MRYFPHATHYIIYFIIYTILHYLLFYTYQTVSHDMQQLTFCNHTFYKLIISNKTIERNKCAIKPEDETLSVIPSSKY